MFEKEWFANKDWWFNCKSEIDTYLKNKYLHLLDRDATPTLEQVLIYDQLPRHFFRSEQCSHIISYYLQKALAIVENLDFELMSDDELCFAFLPWRHSENPQKIYIALDIVWERIKHQPSATLTRFLKATYERMPLVGPALQRTDGIDFDKNILKYCPREECLYSTFVAALSNHKVNKIIISLSGGVDSMVCSWILVNTFPKNKLQAVHINYNNRKTSDEEEKFVANWCFKLGIPCYTRKIHEIQREPCMTHGLRSTYETYTRRLRYHCYKTMASDDDSVVVLGHNKDDILENIFTNIAHKAKYELLDGMTEFSCQDGITFWRPLLVKTKKEIYDYAHTSNIPYLPSSTPEWSHRGQIRSQVVPVLDNWDPMFVEGLRDVSRNMQEMTTFMTRYIDTLVGGGDPIILDKLETSNTFWRLLLARLQVNVSTKCLSELCWRLELWKPQVNDVFRIPLTKSCQLTIKYAHYGYCVSIIKTS